MKKKIVIAISLAAILAACAYAAIDRIAAYALSKAFDLELKYDGLRRSGMMRFDVSGLTCVSRTGGFGISSERATIIPDFRSMAVGFDFYGVRFIRKEPGAHASLDSLSKIVEEPFTGNLSYARISGSAHPIPDGLEITRFDAEGREIRISLKGSVLRGGTIQSDIKISLSPELTEKIPEELSAVLLTDETGGWKTLSVSISGDYKSPSIQVTGKLFRMSVKEVSAS
jgi:hypothetical protein